MSKNNKMSFKNFTEYLKKNRIALVVVVVAAVGSLILYLCNKDLANTVSIVLAFPGIILSFVVLKSVNSLDVMKPEQVVKSYGLKQNNEQLNFKKFKQAWNSYGNIKQDHNQLRKITSNLAHVNAADLKRLQDRIGALKEFYLETKVHVNDYVLDVRNKDNEILGQRMNELIKPEKHDELYELLQLDYADFLTQSVSQKKEFNKMVELFADYSELVTTIVEQENIDGEDD